MAYHPNWWVAFFLHFISNLPILLLFRLSGMLFSDNIQIDIISFLYSMHV